MARLLFFNIPAYGHINPTLKLVKALILEEEEVIYYASEGFREQIESIGAIFRPYPIPFEIDLITISENIFKSAYMLMKYTHTVLPQLLKEVEEVSPDYIMHDSLCIWGKVSARHLKVPAICSSALLHPAVAGGAFKWPLSNLMWKMLWNGIPNLLPYFYQSWHLMRKYSMPFYFVPHAYINQENLNIIYTSSLFHPQSEKLGKDYLLIGPLGSPPVDNSHFPMEKLNDKKVIYISLGTVNSANQIAFYRMCFDAFESLDAIVVLSTGAFSDLSKLDPIPDNFIVRTFIPQARLMPHVDVFVTHGGMNSIHDGMLEEVPMLVIPQTFEQTLNALVIHSLKIGTILRADKEDLSSEKIRRNVDNLLKNRGYKENLALVHQSFKDAGGISSALDAILSVR